MYRIPLYKVMLVRAGDLTIAAPPAVNNPRDMAAILAGYLAGAPQEHFVVVFLNTRHVLIGLQTISIGSLSTTLVHARDVFAPAILHAAACLILGHNHPSGDPTPSAEDRALTRKLTDIGELHGIQVLDHIIVGRAQFYSFHAQKVLPLCSPVPSAT